MGDFKSLKSYLHEWGKEHPEDSEVLAQKAFIENKYGKTIEQLAAEKPERETSSPRRFHTSHLR
jgi:hypothetical protein